MKIKPFQNLAIVLILGSALMATSAQAAFWDLFKRSRTADTQANQCADLLIVPTLYPDSKVLEHVKELGLTDQVNLEHSMELAAYQEPHKINMILTKAYSADQESEINKDIIKIQKSFKGMSFSIGVVLTASSPTATFYALIENKDQRDLFLEKLSEHQELKISSLKASFLTYQLQ